MIKRTVVIQVITTVFLMMDSDPEITDHLKSGIKNFRLILFKEK